MKLASVAPAECLRVRRLTQADLPKALALVRLVAPGLTLASWRAMAERFGVHRRVGRARGGSARPDGCGILAVENAGGTIYALCSLRVVPDVVHQRRLDAENIIVVGIVDESLVRSRLAAALDREARASGCRAISLRDTPVARGAARPPATSRAPADSAPACAASARPAPVNPAVPRLALAGRAPAASYEACATTAYRILG
jgi:hypothetical protein